MTSDVPPPPESTLETTTAGRGKVGMDELVSTYGRLLFELSYRLTGDLREAGELSQEILVRCCLEADRIEDRTDAVTSLYGDLLLLWKGRARRRRFRDLFFGEARGSSVQERGGAGRPHVEHLQPRLMRLDPDSRVVLVLRVGEGLDYEEISSILGIPLDAVRAQLALGRRRVRRRERLEGGLDEMMNLYLDGRLKRAAREEFERREESDAALREAIEFHRGLTLEFREEAPPFPRDFLDRARERLERRRVARRRAGSASPPARAVSASQSVLPWWRRALIFEILAGVAAGLIVAAVLYPGLLRPPKTLPEPLDGKMPVGATDRETIEKLRSLGYLAPGGATTGELSPPAPGGASPRRSAARPGGTGKPRETRRPASLAATPEDSASTRATPATQTPAAGTPAEAAGSTPAPPTAPSPSTPPPPPLRTVRFPKGPDPGRDHLVIRTAAELSAFSQGVDLSVPDIDFEREMLVVLRDDLGGNPPPRLVIVSVTLLAEALEIGCRSEPTDAASTAGGAGATGIAVIVPATDLPVRIVMK